jgi:hypothetical protein
MATSSHPFVAIEGPARVLARLRQTETALSFDLEAQTAPQQPLADRQLGDSHRARLPMPSPARP